MVEGALRHSNFGFAYSHIGVVLIEGDMPADSTVPKPFCRNTQECFACFQRAWQFGGY